MTGALKRSSKAISIFLLLVGVILIAATTERGMLAVQNFFNLPGVRFDIGDITVKKPNHWVLLASRASLGEPERLLGFFPTTFTGEVGPSSRYFTFRNLSVTGGDISFVELAPGDEALMNVFIDNEKTAASCYWMEAKLFDFSYLECPSKRKMIYLLPEARLMITNTGGGHALQSFSVERADKKQPKARI